MTRASHVVVLALVLGLPACAPQMTLAPPELRARAVDFPPPAPGKARLYVYRPDGHDRRLLPVEMDGIRLGSTMRRSFLMVELPPGSHVLASTTNENVSTVRLDVRPGQVYFVKLSPRLGLTTTRSLLVQVDATEGRAAITRSRMVETISR